MQFFLDVALNSIIYDDEILKTAIINGNVTKDNAIYVISNLICEGMVDELNLNTKEMIGMSKVPSEYTPAKNRHFVLAMDNCLPAVVEFLMS